MKGNDGAYLIPTPQTIVSSGSNAGLGFSSYSMPSTYNEHHYVGNGDYVISPRNTLRRTRFRGHRGPVAHIRVARRISGRSIVPGFGASQALSAADIATSLRSTTQLAANTVNEAVMTFTRNRSDTNGVGTPGAAEFGMTAVDPLFAKPPEITVLGPMGSFRLFGSDPNDNHFQTRTMSGGDNVSWVRGKQRLRAAGSSSISTTGAPTLAARAGKSHSRRLKISWSG